MIKLVYSMLYDHAPLCIMVQTSLNKKVLEKWFGGR